MDLKQRITASQQQVNEELTKYFAQMSEVAPKLKEAMQYGVLLGGKRVRPFLVYTVAQLLNGQQSLANQGAVAIECIHAYSLIHDDLPAMDNDKLRRGKPTVHVAFGEATAILAGDALQTMAFEVLANPNPTLTPDLVSRQIAMLHVLANASGQLGMCGGQQLDLESEGRLVNQSELETVHRHKTGALIEASVTMGMLTALNVPQEYQNALQTYAKAIGLAFQVWDDVLDIISDTETLGKPQGSDLEENKSTYPRLMGLEQAKQYAVDLAQKAIDAVAIIPKSEVLQEFAKYIVTRDH